MSPAIILVADLHGHALEYAMSLDRRWFAAHPTADRYERPMVDHEFCSPVDAAAGRCVPLVVPRPGWRIVVEVIELAPGVRARRPWHVSDAA